MLSYIHSYILLRMIWSLLVPLLYIAFRGFASVCSSVRPSEPLPCWELVACVDLDRETTATSLRASDGLTDERTNERTKNILKFFSTHRVMYAAPIFRSTASPLYLLIDDGDGKFVSRERS